MLDSDIVGKPSHTVYGALADQLGYGIGMIVYGKIAVKIWPQALSKGPSKQAKLGIESRLCADLTAHDGH